MNNDLFTYIPLPYNYKSSKIKNFIQNAIGVRRNFEVITELLESTEVLNCDIDDNEEKILQYGIDNNTVPDLKNFTYFIVCYFAKRINAEFDVPIKDILTCETLFFNNLTYFRTLNDSNKELYDSLLEKIKFENTKYTQFAEKLYNLYMLDEQIEEHGTLYNI